MTSAADTSREPPQRQRSFWGAALALLWRKYKSNVLCGFVLVVAGFLALLPMELAVRCKLGPELLALSVVCRTSITVGSVHLAIVWGDTIIPAWRRFREEVESERSLNDTR